MNGHAAMTLRDQINETNYIRIMWVITHLRNLILTLILIACMVSPSIRRGFGKNNNRIIHLSVYLFLLFITTSNLYHNSVYYW